MCIKVNCGVLTLPDDAHADLSSRQLVHFIAFKDHADDTQYLTAATLPRP